MPYQENLASLSDEIIVDLVKDQDQIAFSELIGRYGSLMRSVAYQYTGNNSDTEDVLQESAIQIWEKISTLKNPKIVKSWMVRIVVRKSVDLVRARKTTVDISYMPDPVSRLGNPHDMVFSNLENEAIFRLLKEYSKTHRRIWIMRFQGGFSYQEIAKECGITIDTVRGRLSRMKQKILSEMEQWR